MTSTRFCHRMGNGAMGRPPARGCNSPMTPSLFVSGSMDRSRRSVPRAPRTASAGREGSARIVYVAHVPATAACRSEPRPSSLASADGRGALGCGRRKCAPGWAMSRAGTFNPDGSVAEDLLAVADELRSRSRPRRQPSVFVVGGPPRTISKRSRRSLSLTLADVDRFPLVVVP